MGLTAKKQNGGDRGNNELKNGMIEMTHMTKKKWIGKKNEQRASGTCGPMTKELHLCHEAPCLSIIFNLFSFGYLYIQALRAYSFRFVKPSTLL